MTLNLARMYFGSTYFEKHNFFIKIVFNCIHGNAPKEVAALLVANDSERSTKLKQIKCRGKYGSRAFSFVGPRLWNMLPRYVYETEDVDVFKKNLKTYLMKNGEEFLYHLRSQ